MWLRSLLIGALALGGSAVLMACDDSSGTEPLPPPTGGTSSGGTGGMATGGTATGGTNPSGGSSSGEAGHGPGPNPGTRVSAMPAVGDGMISLWDGAPPLFGPWFTYGYGTGGASCSPEPKQGIVASAEGMCINWSGCGTGQGAAVGFKVCAAPKYPNAEGDSSFFPRACTGANADSCVPSETAKPYSFCGGSVRGVKFAALPMALTVAFLDDTGTNGTVIKEVKVAEGATLAELPEGGERVAAIHFKLPNPPAQGSLCVSGVEVLVTPNP